MSNKSKRTAYLFNPTCEMEVSNGLVSYMPPIHLRNLSKDLSMLPYIYASANDVVLVDHLPETNFLARLEEAGFSLPQFHLLSKVNELNSDYKAQPWGWSPVAAKKLEHFGGGWNKELRPFFSRIFAQNVLEQFVEKKIKHTSTESEVALKIDNIDDVEQLLTKWGQLVIKAPYSSSGRGVQILRSNHFDSCIYNKTKSIIKQQGAVMVEPLLDKITDLAFEFRIENNTVSFAGYSSFTVSKSGQYESHQLPFCKNRLPNEAQELWDNGTLEASKDALREILQQSNISQLHKGYFGVDAMIYRHPDKSIRIQPCIEINLRYNMGIIALYLEKHIAKGSHCDFKIDSRSSIDLSIIDAERMKDYPLVIKNKQISSGYLALTPPKQEYQSMAYIIVKAE